MILWQLCYDINWLEIFVYINQVLLFFVLRSCDLGYQHVLY